MYINFGVIVPLLATAPELGPHTSHLQLDGHVIPGPDEGHLYMADQLPVLELLTHERHNPQTPTIEIVTTDGVSREVTVVNMFMNAYTRFGKFEVITADFRRYVQEHPGARGLYLAESTQLPKDSRQKFDRREAERPAELRLSSGEFHGSRKDDTNVDLLFATIQSMRGVEGYRFAPDHFDYIIVDEAHHTPAPTYKDIIVNHFKPRVRTAITGTPHRLDGLDITEIYGQPVADVPLAEGFVRRRVRDMVYKAMLEESTRDRVEDGKASRADMNRMTRSLDYNLSEMILRAEDEIAQAGIKEPKVLHFAQSITQAEDIAALLGPDSVIIHSEQSDGLNDEALRLFGLERNKGGVSNIVSVNMLNEGVDISCNVLAFYRSTESEAVLFQQLGRGLQIPEDGSSLLVLDFVANAERLKLLYNLIHSITNYTLEADEYRIQPQSEEPDIRRELEAVRGFGAEFDLEDELLEVLQSIADHEQYMEKIRRFEAVTNFDALAYVATSIGGSTPVERKIEERAKRGEGPSVRALMAATGQTIREMLASVAPMGLLRIHKNLNDIAPEDLMILMAKDIVMRHPSSQTDLGITDNGIILWKYLSSANYNGPALIINPDSDIVSIGGQDGSHYQIMPKAEVDPAQQGGSHITNGWSVEIQDQDGIVNAFYPSSDQELNRQLRTKMFTLLGELSRLRQQLQNDEMVTEEYPFYEPRSRHELALVMDRFHGDDPEAEWMEYKEVRATIKHDTRYTNMVKQAMILAQESAKEDSIYIFGRALPRGDYHVFYEPRTRRIIIQQIQQGLATKPISVRIDLKENEIRQSPSYLRERGIPAMSAEDIIKSSLGYMFNARLQDIRTPIKKQRYHDNREQARIFAQDWLDRFAAKVNGSKSYIDDDRLPDFDPFGDDIIGAYVEWPSREGQQLKYFSGVVIGVDYSSGSIDIATSENFKTGTPRSMSFKVLRKDKSGTYVKRGISKHFVVHQI